MDSTTTHHTFIVRIWQEPTGDGNAPISRFILENSATGEREGFTDVEPLLHELRQYTAQAVATDDQGDYS